MFQLLSVFLKTMFIATERLILITFVYLNLMLLTRIISGHKYFVSCFNDSLYPLFSSGSEPTLALYSNYDNDYNNDNNFFKLHFIISFILTHTNFTIRFLDPDH